MSNAIAIRTATPDDAPRLLEIYAPYVQNTAITFEWEVPTLEEFRSRIENTLKTYPYLVAECDGEIIGYTYASRFAARAAYEWVIETSIYVDGTRRRSGVGRALYEALEEALGAMGVTNMVARIGSPRTDDDPYLTTNSAEFHVHMGYRLVGRFHKCGYKFDRWYDSIMMEKVIAEHPDKPVPIKPYNDVRAALPF